MSELSDAFRGWCESGRALAGAVAQGWSADRALRKNLEPLPLKTTGLFSANFKGFGCCAAAKKCRGQTVDALRATA
ncbi:hypothetical protein [Thauera butanivorans]|mgnify:FL=1|uniref:hypothetical protein n=1 Tax=Thauera butanivorans TaxID=86174 RepID=UPI0012F91146|nr:hypothetical protein [Thauera butanivorans]